MFELQLHFAEIFRYVFFNHTKKLFLNLKLETFVKFFRASFKFKKGLFESKNNKSNKFLFIVLEGLQISFSS
jgi:hypothetical protein